MAQPTPAVCYFLLKYQASHLQKPLTLYFIPCILACFVKRAEHHLLTTAHTHVCYSYPSCNVGYVLTLNHQGVRLKENSNHPNPELLASVDEINNDLI